MIEEAAASKQGESTKYDRLAKHVISCALHEHPSIPSVHAPGSPHLENQSNSFAPSNKQIKFYR